MAQVKRNHRYGVSSKFEFGSWRHTVYGPFTCEENAQEWLNRDERDFREKELCSKTKAEKLAGKKSVRNAREFEFHFWITNDQGDNIVNDYFGTYSAAYNYAESLSEDLKTGIFLNLDKSIIEYFPYFD